MDRLMDKLKRIASEKDDNPPSYRRVEEGEGEGEPSDVPLPNQWTPLPPPSPPRQPEPGQSPTGHAAATVAGAAAAAAAAATGAATAAGATPKVSKHREHVTTDFAKQEEDDFDEGSSSYKKWHVSFDKDEHNAAEAKRHYQQSKNPSLDHKSILKDLRYLIDQENRKGFQSKKHVSLDIKKSKMLEDILRGSSSEDEIQQQRREFQMRKHKSMDPRVTFRLDKELASSTSDEDEDEKKILITNKYNISAPVLIDLKEFESSDEEDHAIARRSFQQKKQQSMDSRKSLRFFEMSDLTHKKSEGSWNSVPFIRQITEDGKPMLEVYCPTTNPIYINTQILAALSVSLGSMVVGFSSAYTSPALVSMTDRNVTSFDITTQQASWVGGVMPLAGLVGGICGGPLIEYLGRKNTILATALPFIIAWLLIACANAVWMVLAGRALSGFCVGVASLSLPVYLGETVQPEVRGTLGLLPTAFGNIGILLCFVAGKYMDWSALAFLGGVLPIPFLALMFLIPETPRWYVSRGNENRARKALQWLRGKRADVEPELKGIVKANNDAERHASSSAMLDLLKRNNIKPLAISLGLMFFQQLSGINAVIFYTVSIFKDAGSTIDENLCTIIVGIVNFGATFIATLLIDRLGRKILLYISDVAMVITLFTLGTFFYYKNTGADVSNVGWLPLISFVVFVIGFSLGFGPIPWLMMGEILPGKIRGSAASVATAFNWACTFVVTKTFNDIVLSIGQHGAFWFFGSICLIGFFFVLYCVPETQGKSLEDIERKMCGRVRRMSSVANIKPLSFNM